MKRFEISREEYEQISAAEKATKSRRISKKLQVLIMRYKGKSNKEIGELLEMSPFRVSALVGEYRKQGLQEYTRNKCGGNHRSLSEEQENEILEGFRKKAEAGQEITVQEIKRVFDEKIGKDTGRGYIYMLLERHGWRKVMPRSRHPKKADEETIAASKKLKLR